MLLTLINDFTYTPDSEEVGRLVWERFVARPATERIAGLDDEAANRFFVPALAYRGHLRDAYAVIGRYPGMMAWGAYTGLALACIVPQDSADAAFARELRHAPDAKVSGVQQQLTFPLPWWSARQDTVTIRQYGARLKAIRSPSTWDRYQLEASVAYIALARRDTVEAVNRLRRLPASGPVWYERLTLARLLAGVHRQREALEVLDRGFPWGVQAMERATWALEDARLAEQFGQRDKARYWYGYVARVWRHADPELQPYVAEAREALRRLSAEAAR